MGEEVDTQVVQDIPDGDWPLYPLADRLPDLIGVTFNNIELLDVPSRSWLRIPQGHAVRLHVNIHVFLHCGGVQCHDIDVQYNHFVKPPQAINIRTNMRHKRDFLAVKVRSLSKSDPDSVEASGSATCQLISKANMLLDDSSDSEVEIVEDYAPLPHQLLLSKCKIKAEPSTSYLPTKHLRCLVHNLASTRGFIDPIDIEMLSNSSAAASSTISHPPSNSLVSSSSEHGGSEIPLA
jgi:hypothetical protein